MSPPITEALDTDLSPVNHSVNLRTVNNMAHYSIRKCEIYAQRTNFQTRKEQKHVTHVKIWAAFDAFIYGDKFNNCFPTLLHLNIAP